jgi:hypothetical protein
MKAGSTINNTPNKIKVITKPRAVKDSIKGYRQEIFF